MGDLLQVPEADGSTRTGERGGRQVAEPSRGVESGVGTAGGAAEGDAAQAGAAEPHFRQARRAQRGQPSASAAGWWCLCAGVALCCLSCLCWCCLCGVVFVVCVLQVGGGLCAGVVCVFVCCRLV